MQSGNQRSPFLAVVALTFAISLPGSEVDAQSIIPAGRNFAWNPGMMSKAGVPARTAICATLSPLGNGTDDSTQINSAIAKCPSGQVVYLNPGNFTVNNYIQINNSITLRGAGAGLTILTKTNGARPRTNKSINGVTNITAPVDPASYSYDAQPIIVVGPTRWPSPDSSTSQNLTTDGVLGSSSVTVANASGFRAGTFVLLDETSGSSWAPVPQGFGCTDSIAPSPCPPLVWQGDRVAWNMHYPEQQFQDDNNNSNASGPYDTTPGVLPGAMSWFSRTDRATNEIKEIASVSGNTVTFTSPLSISYRTSHSAQLTRYTDQSASGGANSVQVTNAGVENMSLYGGADGALRFESAAYSWAKAVEVTQWLGEGIAIDHSFRVEARDSYIHTGSWPEPGGAGYMISLANGSSEVLIENNILIDACKNMVFRSSGAGSVVAYNYADDSWDFDTPSWVEVGLNASHMAGPHHVLFEGNLAHNIDSDYTHGNAIYLTFFRNWLTGQRRDFTDQSNMRAIGLAYGSWWDSFVGNVMGRPGKMSGWNYTDPAMSCDSNGNNCTGNNANWTDNDIWKLGYDPERWNMFPDPQTLSTVIRDGNYDFLTNSQRWHNTPGKFAIPNSMYLTSKPAFFGSYTWPWTDPSTGTIYTLPAKARYEAGTPFVVNHTHDFSGDGRSDIAWRDGSGNTVVWLMNGGQVLQSGSFGTVPTSWSIVAQRDFNGDSKNDLLWRDGSGNTVIWFLNGVQVAGSASLGNVPTSWSVAGTGDFNGDGKGDILWRDSAGNVAVWLMNGGQVASAGGFGAVPTTWTVAGIGDFDGDGKSDILWRDGSGNTVIWFLNGLQAVGSASLGNIPTSWSVAGTGDFDGDGMSDILWRDTSGNLAIWLMNGGQIASSAGFGTVPTSWSVAETGDFDGDGKSDILWRDISGNLAIWFLSGSQIKSAANLGGVSVSWTIQSANAD